MASTQKELYKEKGDTWPKILKYNYEKYGASRKAMRHKHYGVWEPVTWADYYLSVKYLALGLQSLGFEPEDRLLIMGDNAPEWYYSELAAQSNHGISVGLCPELAPSEIKYIAENSDARFAIAQGQEQVDKFLEAKQELPRLERVIYWNYKGLAHYGDSLLMGIRQVLELGREHEEKHPGVFERGVETGSADNVCAIVYTSGTTGDSPKGCLHTFRTLMTGAIYHLLLDPWYEDDNLVPYLPPAWITEQWWSIGCHLLSGCTLNFAEAPETQYRDVSETGPSIVVSGARIWESQAATVQARMLAADVIKKFAFRLLMPIGYKAAELKFQKKKPGLFLKALRALADALLFRPLKRSLGLLNARICYTTGAILSPEALRFYHAIGVPLKSLYSTTEGGALTGAKNNDVTLDTVGPAHKGSEVKIADDGEIIYRQPGVFLGYCKDPERTAQVLEEGWFHTGDGGFINKNGHIVIIDRLEDIIELPGGEKIAPQLIESRLRFSPYIKDAWILAGQGKEYALAIVVINYDAVSRWAGKRKVAYTGFADLSQKPEVISLVKREIDRINQSLPPGVMLKKYVNLHREFSPDEGELTRTRKLRRRFLQNRLSELINAMYNEKTEVPLETLIKHWDGSTEKRRTIIRINSA